MHFVVPVPPWEEGGACQGGKSAHSPSTGYCSPNVRCVLGVTPGPVATTPSDEQLVSSGTQSQGRWWFVETEVNQFAQGHTTYTNHLIPQSMLSTTI